MPENGDMLATEDVIRLASTLAENERVHCSVQITPIMRLDMYLHNKVYTRALPQIRIEVLNPAQMRFGLFFHLNPHSVQEARINGRSRLDPGILNIEDIVNIFELDASVKWQVYDIYKIIEGTFHRVEDGRLPMGVQDGPDTR